MNKIIHKLEDNLYEIKSEFAQCRVDETLDKESQLEAWEEELAKIESIDPQDTHENRIWEN